MSVLDYEAQWCRAEIERMKREGDSKFDDWFGNPTQIKKTMERDLKTEADGHLKTAEEFERQAQQHRIQAQLLLDAHEKFTKRTSEDQA
jgi:hypothetical protein